MKPTVALVTLATLLAAFCVFGVFTLLDRYDGVSYYETSDRIEMYRDGHLLATLYEESWRYRVVSTAYPGGERVFPAPAELTAAKGYLLASGLIPPGQPILFNELYTWDEERLARIWTNLGKERHPEDLLILSTP